MTKWIAAAVVAVALVAMSTHAGRAKTQSVKPPVDPELFRIIEAQDAALFDSYNKCDLDKFIGFFDDNVEFYHDNGGVTLGSKALTESVKKNICGTTQRQLVPGTLEVFRIAGYGAVEMGTHRFTHPNAKPPIADGEGRFVHLWRYKDGTWKVTRVISYDHHEAGK
jgi:ketosteroid isomerase-like protein